MGRGAEGQVGIRTCKAAMIKSDMDWSGEPTEEKSEIYTHWMLIRLGGDDGVSLSHLS